MSAVFAYTWWRLARTKQWIVPGLLYLLLVVVLNPPGGSFQGSGAIGVILILGASAWLTLTAFTSEGMSQAMVTRVSVGGAVRLRLGVALAALSASSVLALVSTTLAFVRRGDVLTLPETALACAFVLTAHLSAALLGGAIGVVFGSPVVSSTALVVWLALLCCVAVIGAPVSPLPIALGALGSDGDPTVPVAMLAAVGVTTWVAGVLATSRAGWR